MNKWIMILLATLALSAVAYVIYKKSYERHLHEHSRLEMEEHSHAGEEHDRAIPGHSLDEEEHEEHGHHEATHWTEEKLKQAEVSIQSAEPGSIQNVIRAPGRISIHPNQITYVIPKVAGTVKVIKKEPGDAVKEGEVLAVLESKEIAEARSAYLAALKRLNLKKAILAREEELRRISPEQDYLQAKSAVEEAAIEAELTKQKLHALGLNDQEIEQIPASSGESFRLYQLQAPLEGEVIQRDLTLGELVDSQHRAYTIVNFDQVRATFSVSPSSLPFIKKGQAIEILSSDGRKAKTTIFYVEPMINDDTRNAMAAANLDNQSREWLPGQFVTAIIQKEAEPVAILVSKEAIQKIKGQDVVFIFAQETFTPRAIKIGRRDGQNVEVISGLQPGEQYAANNTFLLKADLEKEEAEHSHAH